MSTSAADWLGSSLSSAWLWSRPRPAAAHDVENTHVLITFTSEGTYQIDVLNDADWLWLRLAPQTKALPPVAECDHQLTALTGRFVQEIRLMFDDLPVEVGSVEYVPPLGTAPSDGTGWHEPGMMRLAGRVPDGASAFRFAYRLIEDPYTLTVLPPQGEAVTRWLKTGEVSETFEITALRPLTRLQVSAQYLGLGFTHILFVIGLFLLSIKLKPLLWQVTAFTIAYTITLGLAIYEMVSLSPAIVEPLIALSIAYVAVENLVTTELKPWRVGLVFARRDGHDDPLPIPVLVKQRPRRRTPSRACWPPDARSYNVPKTVTQQQQREQCEGDPEHPDREHVETAGQHCPTAAHGHGQQHFRPNQAAVQAPEKAQNREPTGFVGPHKGWCANREPEQIRMWVQEIGDHTCAQRPDSQGISHGRLRPDCQTLIRKIGKERRAPDGDRAKKPVRLGDPHESQNREPDDRQVSDQRCDRDLDALPCAMAHAVCHHEHEQRPRCQSGSQTQHDA